MLMRGTRSNVRLTDLDGERFKAAQVDPPVPGRRAVDPEPWESADGGADGDLRFEPGERGAEAVVDPAAERHVLVGPAAGDVERFGGGSPLVRITVGGGQAGEHEHALRDRAAAELDVVEGDASRHLDRADEPQQLV